jgi:sulfur carrier protein
MKITINGLAREVAAEKLDQALDELGYRDGFVATAVNGEFVAKAARPDKQLSDGDRIEIVAPMQGG